MNTNAKDIREETAWYVTTANIDKIEGEKEHEINITEVPS